MYRDNPLAFWSETADNSLNWKLQPELNYPELPWKLQTTKLNYNYLEYRSKTAGNSLCFYKSSQPETCLRTIAIIKDS